ncbi:MAG: monovalent cation/H+ antiporter subunit E [bacterium]|nr:monovalent cation/H+ antiporter subunit E [bacterium]
MSPFHRPLYTTLLALVWVMLQADFTLGQLALGYLVAAGIVWACGNFAAPQVTLRRPTVALRLAWEFVREVVMANLQVAWIIVQPRPPIRPAFIVVPLDLRDDLEITAFANMITLTPGTLTVDVAPDRSALYVHCLAVDDVDAVRAQLKRQFEAPLAQAVTCSPS